MSYFQLGSILPFRPDLDASSAVLASHIYAGAENSPTSSLILPSEDEAELPQAVAQSQRCLGGLSTWIEGEIVAHPGGLDEISEYQQFEEEETDDDELLILSRTSTRTSHTAAIPEVRCSILLPKKMSFSDSEMDSDTDTDVEPDTQLLAADEREKAGQNGEVSENIESGVVSAPDVEPRRRLRDTIRRIFSGQYLRQERESIHYNSLPLAQDLDGRVGLDGTQSCEPNYLGLVGSPLASPFAAAFGMISLQHNSENGVLMKDNGRGKLSTMLAKRILTYIPCISDDEDEVCRRAVPPNSTTSIEGSCDVVPAYCHQNKHKREEYWGLRSVHYSPEYIVEDEANGRLIEYHTSLSPPPWRGRNIRREA